MSGLDPTKPYQRMEMRQPMLPDTYKKGVTPKRTHVVSSWYLQHKLKEKPSNARLHKNLAPLLQEQGQRKQALKHLKCAVEFNPIDVDARNDYGLELFRLGRWDEAITEFHKALKVQPKHVCVHKNLSATYARRGRYKQAIHHAEEAVRLNPRDAQAHRNLAKLLDATGNSRDAVKHNRNAIQLGPGVRAGHEKYDTDTYRLLATQLVGRGELQSGHVHEHYDAFRALAGKRYILPNSERTTEILIKTRSLDN
mmetsp:Transcript_11014/g.25575  ORF Transcript_11014/g.25575 Transcript_11014/m.25575 type:complete len:253 (-) Transcript_11014:207-965(-)